MNKMTLLHKELLLWLKATGFTIMRGEIVLFTSTSAYNPSKVNSHLSASRFFCQNLRQSMQRKYPPRRARAQRTGNAGTGPLFLWGPDLPFPRRGRKGGLSMTATSPNSSTGSSYTVIQKQMAAMSERGVIMRRSFLLLEARFIKTLSDRYTAMTISMILVVLYENHMGR